MLQNYKVEWYCRREKKAQSTELLVVLHQSVDEFSDQEKVRANLKSFVTSVNDFDISKLSGKRSMQVEQTKYMNLEKTKLQDMKCPPNNLDVNQYDKLPQDQYDARLGLDAPQIIQ